MAAVMLQAFALTALLSTVSATITINLGVLPPITLFPSGCGRIAQISQGATCQKLADDNGISLAKFQALNPLTICLLPLISLIPGNRICVGDTLSYCNNYYVASQAGTCSSLNIGGILTIGGGGSCSNIKAGSQLCLAPPTNQCAVTSFGGVPISTDLQDMFELVPDYCSIVSSGEGTLAPSTYGNKSSLKLTLNSATPAVVAVAGNDGHPELNSFLSKLQQGPVQLEVNFVPGGLSDGGNYIDYTIQDLASGRRKLLGGYIYRGGTRTPCCRYY